MRTVHRVLSTMVAVGAAFPVSVFAAVPAHAATTPVAVETSAWFWRAQQSGTPAGVPGALSGVPSDRLAVAFAGETKPRPDGTKESVPDKETYLAWDVYTVPEKSTVDSFVFTILVDTEASSTKHLPEVAPPGQTPRGGAPKLVACLPKSGFGAAEGDSFANKPEDDCSEQIFGEYDPVKSSYTFDATVIAQDWVDGRDNFGLAIRPTEDETDLFQLVLKPAPTVLATLAYTPPAEEEPEPIVEPDDDQDLGGSGTVTPPTFTGGSGYVPAPAPQAPPAPVKPTVAPKPRKVAVQPVVSRPVSVDSGIGGEFWLAMLCGVLVLGIASLVLGDPLVPAAAAREDALTRALRQRRAGGRVPVGAGVPGRARPRTL